MSDPIKFIFIVSADRAGFRRAANERTIELCGLFYAKRLKPGAVLPAPAILRFVHFDCLSNAINVFEFSLSKTTRPRPPAKGAVKWTPLKDFVGAGDPRFSPRLFVDASPGILTMPHVYHSIRGAPPKSVLELSIFAHAFEEGPIVQDAFNSTDATFSAPVSGPPRRHQFDTDGRARTDFEDNMGENPTDGKPAGVFPRTGGKNALKEFKAGFDPKATFIVFGCNGQDSVRNPVTNVREAMLKSSVGQVINQAFLLPTAANEAKKKNDAARRGAILATGKVPADFKVRIDMGWEFDDERRDIAHGGAYSPFNADETLDKVERRKAHYALDDHFFPAPTSTVLVWEPKWSSILGFVARRTQKTYAFKAAVKLGIDVLAGPQGTKTSLVENSQMKVCGARKVSQCTRTVKFYELFMRKSPHPKAERRYFVYDPGTVAHINALAQNH